MKRRAPPAPPPFNIVNFANAQVFNQDGKQVKLGNIWKNQTTVFIFLRHFACVSCRTHAVQVWSERDKYQATGAQVVFIGNGSPDFIQKFREDLGLGDAPIFVDPALDSFRAAGFKRGFLAALGPSSIAAGIKMFGAGNKQGEYSRAAGDLWQLGGIVVIRPSGAIAFHHISQVLGDYPPHTDIPE